MNLKTLLSVLVLVWIVAGCSVSKPKQSKTDEYSWFPFSWYAATISGKQFDKVAMLIPAKVNDLKASFTFQFDLGSNGTSIYGNTIKNYYSDSAMKDLLHGSQKSFNDGGVTTYRTKNFAVQLNKLSVTDISYMENYGEAIPVDSLFTQTEKHVGTLGANVFKDKVLIIDYPNQRMCVLDSVDSYWEKRSTFVDAQSTKGRLHIPLTIKGKVYWFLFDTGASLFPVNTHKALWNDIVDHTAPVDTIVANSWGEKVGFFGAPIKEQVYLGSRLLDPSKAWYNENKRLLAFNASEKIEGTSGNAYFFSNTVVLDFRNKRFGVVGK
jgi:hypothetical protein